MAGPDVFPKFSAGDPPGKLLDHKLLNSAFDKISSAEMPTVGRPDINNATGGFSPDNRPPVEIRLAKIMEFQTSTATSGFVGPTGQVNVIKAGIVDALFPEVVGTQTVSEQSASSEVIFAAANPDFDGSVGDFIWVKRWSHQWWVESAGGAATTLKHGIVRTLCDQDCNTYSVEIVERTFDETCTGTGTGT